MVISLPPATDAQITRLFRVIESDGRSLERQDFVPSPGLQCSTCKFIHGCQAWH